ncbi:hypothetical protein QQS21_012843 [Conoideocrella luteorostrata]|uniref:ABC transmembrane type-1 domain-containing protein n=1 Tax=Conoideocrella luteorostrata TaxID=1105319 RepID=A0AAJ0FLZ3_9HYPO|nr:hypothetical protein QQS21_012843 [Conoideocrella luteorostrata]
MSVFAAGKKSSEAEKSVDSSTPTTTDDEKQDPCQDNEPDAKARPERTATFSDYLRVFKYASKWDFVAYAAGAMASIGAGITLPLMNVIFGKFVGNFTSFASFSVGGGGISKDEFQHKLDQLA